MQQKPIFLNLLQIKFPLAAKLSILHRISGLILFLLIPCLLYIFEYSLANQDYFNNIKFYLTNEFGKSIALLFIAFFLYHLLAGIRHLIMDCGYAESKEAGTTTAAFTLIIFLVSMVLAGVWLW